MYSFPQTNKNCIYNLISYKLWNIKAELKNPETKFSVKDTKMNWPKWLSLMWTSSDICFCLVASDNSSFLPWCHHRESEQMQGVMRDTKT